MSKVLLILVDGMRPDALTAISHPELETFFKEGACTLAGTTVMPSVTLPCHMSLMHSVDPQRHGVLTNTYVPQVRPVQSLFDQLNAHGKKNGFFYNWSELRDLHRPGSVAYECCISGRQYTYEASNPALAEMAARFVKAEKPDFTFLYLGEVDDAGHKYGWMSPEYLDAVSRSFDCIRWAREAVSEDTVVLVTADHGGHERSHGTEAPEDMTIPLLTWNGPWEKGSTLGETNIKDIAPTIAKLLDVPADGDWEGHALF